MEKYQKECSNCFAWDKAETEQELALVMANHLCETSGNAYTVTRLESWSNETWAEVVYELEKLTESFGE